MKKKFSRKISICLVCAMGLFLVACGNNGDNSNADENVGIEENNSANESGGMTGSETGTDENATTNGTDTSATNDATANGTTNGATNGTTNGTDANTATGQAGTPAASEANPINDKIRGYYSETVAYPLLESEIIDELDYENLDMSNTRYYYNYVDLNDDGVDEIVVQLNGNHNTTKDGDTLLILEQEKDEYEKEDDEFDVIAQYTAFTNPVIISDNKTNGYKDIIFMNPDGKTYSKIEFGSKAYKKMKDAVQLNNIDNVTGVALLCNDIASDTNNGTGLFFS